MADDYPRELGCLAEALLIGAVYIIIFAVIIPLVFGVRIGGTIPMLVAAAIVGWFLTRRYRKNMEKRLGRKVKGDHELTSISSWMEASTKEEQTRLTPATPNMSPKEKLELAKKNMENYINVYRTEGKDAARTQMAQLLQVDENEPNPADVEYKIITAGGRENGPLDVDTIRDLFNRNLVNNETLVFDPLVETWCPLADVFDVTEWERLKGDS
ncbi:MAG TPA: DUF4199 domain-containing protein [Pyrinomonadaceae bacterium]|jgi:hypothetical protein